MDAHEWNESLDRIISRIAEMIDLLKNESRRWATSPIFSTPLPSPAVASPPPTSAPVPTLPPPVSATAPTTSVTPKQAARIALLPPKSAPFTVTKPTTPPTSYPREATFMRDLKISYKASLHPKFRVNNYTPFTKKEKMVNAVTKTLHYEHYVKDYHHEKSSSKEMVTPSFNHYLPFHVNNGILLIVNEALLERLVEKHDWRPPWRFTKTTLNAIERVEWRPPWGHQVLSKFSPCGQGEFEQGGLIRATQVLVKTH
ncbi:hypothetical protein HanRHA438_Chr13g0605891 [Helianthus annuus]|nr:hypothetical protein HanIR_Chr13g0647531 [Helianthus annuus]KAJ0849805.1 hypothetical protein HanPSC8_Chr13g0573191 [Helianthus annuus]KAJ0858856.1 hypothetical protein HanRHA438_Chr13g0605891 [Helianthus annuus]